MPASLSAAWMRRTVDDFPREPVTSTRKGMRCRRAVLRRDQTPQTIATVAKAAAASPAEMDCWVSRSPDARSQIPPTRTSVPRTPACRAAFSDLASRA